MRIIIDLNKKGTKICGELQFTGPCARHEGNAAYRALKELQKVQKLNGTIGEPKLGYKPNNHQDQYEVPIDFPDTDADTITQVILNEIRREFPDAQAFVDYMERDGRNIVVISDIPIPPDISRDCFKTPVTINGKEVLIDTELQDIISTLNNRGFTTRYCCAGHWTGSDGTIKIGEKTIELRSIRPSISSGYIMFEYTDKTADLFKRLEESCEFCKNGEASFGTDEDGHLNMPLIDDREPFENDRFFYTEYPKEHNGKKSLTIRWTQRTDRKILETIKNCLL